MDNTLIEARREFSINPDSKEAQAAFCSAFMRAGQPGAVEGVCLIPWCETKPTKKKTLCGKHNKDEFPGMLGLRHSFNILVDTNFYYYPGIEVEGDYVLDCESYGCDDNGDYCRCGVYENLEVTVDPLKFAESVVDKVVGKSRDIHSYCAARLVHIFVRNSADDGFEAESCGGYYGEEIDNVTWTDLPELMSEIEALRSRSDTENVKHVLTLDYGHLLPGLESLRFSLKQIPSSLIEFGSQTRRRELSKRALDYYASHDFPRGVVREIGDRYRLVDGYHRVSASSTKTIPLIVGS